MVDPYEIFDALSELVYVSDIETYDLLYVNEPMARMFDGPWQGRKCYKMLQGLDEPCSFCTNERLIHERFVAWVHYNKVFGRHYALKDKLVDWDGRQARFELAFDITEDVAQKAALESQLGLETLLVDCIMAFRKADGLEGDTREALDGIGRFFGADRVYIVEIGADRLLSSTREWSSEDIVSEIDKLQDISLDAVARWLPHFERRDCVIVDDLESIREVSPNEYGLLGARGIASFVAAPLVVNDCLFGYIGADNPSSERIGLSAPFFKTIALFLSMEIEQSQTREKLRRMSYEDSLTGAKNRNRYIEDLAKLDQGGARTGFGVMYIDLNGLKDVNDLRGHAVGDSSLVAAAEILTDTFTRADVYRLGGDEFLVVSLCADLQTFEKEVECASVRLASQACSASIGTHYAAEPCTIEDAVRIADERMYEDKRLYYRDAPEKSRHQGMYASENGASC